MYALITGASSGIGKETAVLLAKKGYNLIIAARREKRLIGLKNQIAKLYDVDIVIKICDLSNTENITNLYNECQKYDINVVVNNGKVIGNDSIYMEVKYSDDPDHATYIFKGHRANTYDDYEQ